MERTQESKTEKPNEEDEFDSASLPVKEEILAEASREVNLRNRYLERTNKAMQKSIAYMRSEYERLYKRWKLDSFTLKEKSDKLDKLVVLMNEHLKHCPEAKKLKKGLKP